MMLENQLYFPLLQEKHDAHAIFSIRLNADHPVYHGHFPGNPVTPGVVQMEMVKSLVSLFYERKMNLVSMASCKFIAILNPGNVPAVQGKIDCTLQENEQVKISAVLTDDQQTYFKMSAVYAPDLF